MRWIARSILVLISFVWYSPYVHASIERINKTPAQNRIENYYPLGAELEILRKNLVAYAQTLSQYQQPLHRNMGEEASRPVLNLEQLDLIKQLDQGVRDEMSINLAHLQRKQLPEQIIQRQLHTLEQYQEHMSELYTTLASLQVKPDASFEGKQQAQLNKALGLLSQPLSTPHESLSSGFDFSLPAARSMLTTQAQINSLLGADSVEYLSTDSATDISVSIQNKVSELGGDTLTLYNWVHDNVRWLPSYGVMQGADYTLQAEQGNAFDTSSLLISLLRAAGHEARYRYGVVQAPIDKMRNWVGNVKNAAGVANLLSQGGIPQIQASYGGAIEEIHFEHVWVEVKEGNNWLPLDPSFKQYDYSEGLDLESAVSFDAQGLLTQLQNSSTSNETEGWVQGVDANLINSELTNYQNQLENYLTNNAPNATLGDVLGLQTIKPSSAATLEDAVPDYTVQLSATVAQLPETLFHTFRYQIGSSVSYDLGNSFSWGSEYFQLNELTTNLVGKDIALSFRPATADDQATIESYLPETIESVEDLPNTLPAGSINMIGELTIDGQVMYSTPPISLGASLKSRLGYIPPQANYKYSENNIVAGQYQAIGIDMQGISPTQLEVLQSKLENTQTQLEANNTQSLTKHDVVGNIIQAGIQGYMAMTYATDRIAAQAAGVVYYRQPSYGTFSTQMEVSYLITGTPKQVSFTGVAMDVDQIHNNVEEKKNCYEGWVAFNRASGMRSSAYEHQIPEQLFSTGTEQAEGVSTAKALALAMAQGQRIYTLTSANASQLTFITIDDGSRTAIQQALAQGLEVTVHQSPITVNGWQGSGYSVIDSETGIGAYQISGGVSGGFYSMLKAIDGNAGSIAIGTFLISSLFGTAVIPLVGTVAMVGLFVSLVLVFAKISILLAVNDNDFACGTGILLIALISASFAALGLAQLTNPMVSLMTNLITRNAVPATLCK